MNGNRTRSLAAGALVGVAFHFVVSYLVGFVAVIAFPPWYTEFAKVNPKIALILWGFVTVIPVICFVSVVLGIVLARLISCWYFVAGLVAIITANLIDAALVIDVEFFAALRMIALPSAIVNIPSFLAIWITLPLAAAYFGRHPKPA